MDSLGLGEQQDYVAMTRAKLFAGPEGRAAQDKAVSGIVVQCLEDFRVAGSLALVGGGGGAAPPPPPELALLTKLLERE